MSVPWAAALAATLAGIDVFSALAEVAVRHNYIRSALNDGHEIEVKQGRHPVVERSLDEGIFIPNDISLANDDAQLIVLTGPNMSGKSTYLRQVALIVLLAQIGSFVPAEAARIGIVDVRTERDRPRRILRPIDERLGRRQPLRLHVEHRCEH